MTNRHTVAVFLADPARAACFTEPLGREGLEPVLAHSSDELYSLINHRRIDAVVIENPLRGFLRGVEIVERLACELVRPVTVLVGDLTVDEQQRAARLKIDQIVANRDDTASVIESLKRSLLLACHPGVLVPAAARSLVQQCDAIRPLPQLLVKLAAYLDSSTASMADLARDISVDPTVTADLLKLTNSAALGLRGKVTRVLDAINLLGARRTVALILSSSVHGAQGQMLKPLPKAFRTLFRVRSVLIGATAATFSKRLNGVSPDQAYILGLLQDLGMLVLAQAYGERYVQLVEHARSVGSLRLEHCEDQYYGVTHADVSAALLQKWALPSSLITLVLDHHQDSDQPTRSDTERNFLRAMQIGEAVADLREGPSPQRHRYLNRLLEPCGGSHSDLCRSALAEAVARTQESCRLFDIPVPDDAEVARLQERLTSDVAPDGDEAEPTGAATHVGPEHAAAPVAGPSTVLVIDDDPGVINAIRMHLQPLGVHVHGTGSAADTRPLVPHTAAVLCDLHLDGASGFDVVRELKRHGLKAPVIALSGDCSRSTVAQSISAGMVGFIIKPFSRATLVDKLRRHAGLNLEPAATV